jgi:hypothetical protein
MAYNVAQAEVTVVPDARGFGTELRAQIAAEADRIGREAGNEIAEGIRERVRVGLADLPDAHIDLDVDTTGARAQVDEFVASTRAKAKVGGTNAGRDLANGVADGISARSALIGSAIGLGIIAGGPIAVAAVGTVFTGLAAVIVHNQENVANAAAKLGTQVSDAYSNVAQVAVPYLVKALDTVRAAAVEMAPQVGQLFKNLGPAVDGLTNGVVRLASGALPGLNAAMATSKPVFQGLANLLGSIGSGLGSMFSQISQHAPAMGTVLTSLGSILDSLFDTLGTVISAGAELGSTVLPPLAGALRVLADVLGALEPILPEPRPGVRGVEGRRPAGPDVRHPGDQAGDRRRLGHGVGGRLTGLEAAGLAAGTGFEAAATGARGLEAAMGPIGWIIAGISLVIPLFTRSLGDQDAGQKRVTSSAQKP